ncbi:MAG TPA: hypothetical protein H9914_13945 [Candidatus Blautia avicola]|uniref:Deacetylase sirtuin-type domain-containing protein n=1 Tax=Candidatus Blautia avicola TaxID=2838483 RepID=A0A9D2TYS9_9FIRM|nr:hypothetical protein [Candidatus Blautia avicola]
MFPNRLSKDQEGSDIEKIRKLGKALEEAEAVIIGAGAGLSASAGFVYTGERFQAYFSDFEEKFLELGVGYNTPVIIKYPFWQMTCQNPEAVYACINYGDAAAPREIGERSICIDGDIGAVLEKLK